MKHRRIFFIITLFITCAEVNSSTVNFSDFFKNFKLKNPELVSAQNQAEATKIRSEAIYYLLMPTLSFGHSEIMTKPIPDPLSTYDRATTTTESLSLIGTIPQAGLSYSSNLYNINDNRYFDGQDKTSQSIAGSMDFGISFKLLKGFGPSVGSIPFDQADLNKTIADLQKKNTLLNGVSNLIGAYNNVYASLNNLKISQNFLKTNDADVLKAEKQHKEGLIPYLSLLTLKSQNTTLKKNIINLTKSLRDNVINLYNLTGEKLDPTQFQILDLKQIQMPDEFKMKIESWMNSTQVDPTKTNPEILLKKASLRLTELDFKKAKNNVLPDLSLNAKYLKNSDRRYDYIPTKGESQEVAVTLSMPIGLVSERAEASAKNLEIKSRQNELEISILRTIQDWENLGQQFRLSLEQLSMAKELVEVAKKQYDSALPTATLGPTYQANIVNFQNQLLSAQLDLNQSQADLLNLMVRIYVIKGDISFISYLDQN